MKDINFNFYDTYFQPILWFQLYLKLLVNILQFVILQVFFFYSSNADDLQLVKMFTNASVNMMY